MPNRHGLIVVFAAVAVFAIIFGVSSKKQLGTNFESCPEGYYYYFPERIKDIGVVPFNKIRSKDHSGTKIVYSRKVLYDSAAAENAGSTDMIPRITSNSRKDVGNYLIGEYYNDGRLKSVGYNRKNPEDVKAVTGQNYTVKYLSLSLYDENDKRASDYAQICARMFASDITNSINISIPDQEITRLYLKCEKTETEGYFLNAYISDDTTGYDEQFCTKIELLSTEGADCQSYLNALIFSDGANENDMYDAAEKTASLLNGEFALKLNRSGKYYAIVVNSDGEGEEE